ncbi:MAG: hypothetical protein KDA61_02850, partial [Planctomycetales bacterium]|nr:hypothetical protein [Planctomycetales bacterium]
MDEQIRNEVIHRWGRGQSQREIARRLRLSRNTVKAVLGSAQAAREGSAPAVEAPTNKRRASMLDSFDEQIKEILGRHPEMPAVEVLRRLRHSGFQGSYTILRQRVNRLRERFPDDLMADVTAPGVTAIVSFTTLQLACGDGARQDA